MECARFGMWTHAGFGDVQAAPMEAFVGVPVRWKVPYATASPLLWSTVVCMFAAELLHGTGFFCGALQNWDLELHFVYGTNIVAVRKP